MRNQSTLTVEERERFAYFSNDPQASLLAELADAPPACDVDLAEFVREHMSTLLAGLQALQAKHEDDRDEYGRLGQLSIDLQSLGEDE